MKLLKNKILMMGIIVIAVLATAIPAFASDDNIPFSFNLQAGGANSYLSDAAARYRQTTNTSNPWKVKVIEQRGDSDYTATYWLARTAEVGHPQVSDAHNVKSGTGAHYYNARATASKVDIVLGADNNNNVASFVKGVWDEETY